MDLATDWARLRAHEPQLRIRDAADRLGVPEAALVALTPGARPLRDPRGLLSGLPAVGRVMALTRNAGCVHERHGRYEAVQARGPVGLVLGPDIDLRLFFAHWGPAWEVPVPLPGGGDRPSVQVFSPAGEAVHKIYLDPVHGDRAAWDALIAAHLTDAPPQLLPAPAPAAPPPPPTPTAAAALLDGWAALRDTHDFFGLLQRHGVSRRDALRAAEGRFTRRLAPAALPALLHGAAAAALPIMVFVGNPGCIQIHTGPVRRVVEARGWLNVLDPDFNLHLHQGPAAVAEVWEVLKPTVDGGVTAVEVLDSAGGQTVQLFGARKPGVPEDGRWRAMLGGLMGWGEAGTEVG